ncbi:hypothetical protein BS47DRAFT_1368865 [Hydnum rufescens UP504]|uniref:Uncharacterized protein n=1 Tax=Hydnum rufescens UP504 TaxID=1448309 RepID=A0A9P6AFE6_9AGAM|nr:hypothetical protein BS47DRAFT_1368865 [Hydnum rufescens UP504]
MSDNPGPSETSLNDKKRIRGESASLSDPAREQDLPKSEDGSGLVIHIKYNELRNTKKVKNIFSPRQPGAKGWAPKGENPLPLRHGQGQVQGRSQGRQPRLGMPPRNVDSLSSGSEIPIDPVLLSNNDTISLHDGGVMDFSSLHASMGTDTPIEYEIFNGGDPHSTEWHALCIQHLRILIQHLPDVGTIASQGDYLGSYIPQSYEEW